jgi:hypothetical protein
MSLNCTHENCFPDTACALGHIDRADCDYWPKCIEGDTSSEEKLNETISDIPWNGYALGTRDLSILGGRGHPFVIGLIGPPNSGKTSLLAYIYMWLLKNGKLQDWQLAGSWTLGGWESVVRHCRWTGEPPPTFPPHTSSAGRHPGILHLAFRDPRNQLRDVMFTDAPGEWFTLWSKVPNDPAASGARWVIEHSDALLLLIDSAALADTEKLPQARRATRNLIDRISAISPHHRLTTVWAKDDVLIPQHIYKALQQACDHFLPNVSTCRTTYEKPETIVQCFVNLLSAAYKSELRTPIVEPRLSQDPFLAFRGINYVAG